MRTSIPGFPFLGIISTSTPPIISVCFLREPFRFRCSGMCRKAFRKFFGNILPPSGTKLPRARGTKWCKPAAALCTTEQRTDLKPARSKYLAHTRLATRLPINFSQHQGSTAKHRKPFNFAARTRSTIVSDAINHVTKPDSLSAGTDPSKTINLSSRRS